MPELEDEQPTPWSYTPPPGLRPPPEGPVQSSPSQSSRKIRRLEGKEPSNKKTKSSKSSSGGPAGRGPAGAPATAPGGGGGGAEGGQGDTGSPSSKERKPGGAGGGKRSRQTHAKTMMGASCTDPPRVFVKWVPADAYTHEQAALSSVRGLPGAVQLLARPIRSPCGLQVGFVMPRLARYPLEGLDLPRIRAFFLQLLEILRKCATRRIAHLDLKPEHLRLGDERELLLIDWGGAVLQAPSRDHWFLGTRGWRAPELTRDPERYLASPAADVYSAGLLLLHALKDVRAFREACPRAARLAAAREEVDEETLAAEVAALDVGTLLGRLASLLPLTLRWAADQRISAEGALRVLTAESLPLPAPESVVNSLPQVLANSPGGSPPQKKPRQDVVEENAPEPAENGLVA